MSGEEFSLFRLFREEVCAHTATLSAGLLELEGDPGNRARIEPLMRAAHSLKGAARIVNIEPAVQLAHAAEDALVGVQEGRIRLDPLDIDSFLKAADLLATLSQIEEAAVAAWVADHQTKVNQLTQVFQQIQNGRPVPAPVVVRAAEAATPAQPPPALFLPVASVLTGSDYSMLDLYREEVRIHTASLDAGLRRLPHESLPSPDLDTLIQAAHTLYGGARLLGLEPAVSVSLGLKQVLAAVRDGGLQFQAADLDLCGRSLGLLASLLEVNEDTVLEWVTNHSAAAAELRHHLDRISSGANRPVAVVPPPVRALVPQEPADRGTGVPPVMASEQQQAGRLCHDPAATEDAMIRVTAQSLNRLMSLAGESLVQARWLAPFSTALLKLRKHQDHLRGLLDAIGQTLTTDRPLDGLPALVSEARQLADNCRQVLAERMGEFDDHAGQAEDLNSRLYREIISSRMRPFADGAHAFPRLVRDMGRTLDRKVRLEIEGKTTPVDRDILEKLEAPLNHLLRNAVDHAIEPPEQRRAAGKPETGLIRIEARHRAGMLAITVSDDGKGIDPESLRRKVVERGLTTAAMAQALSEAELLEFLFLPGFSTAAAVTEYSGRGVGLDVVQTAAREVGGAARVTTRPGRGTTFHLQLPITLSVLRAVLVAIAGEMYAFPHNRIERILRVPRLAVHSLENRQYLILDGQNIGLVLAAQILDLPAAPPDADEVCVVLLADATGRYGLIVESVRGEQDLVVRPLDARLGKVPNLSAAAILDDGAPVLIVDTEDLIRSMDQHIQGRTLQRCERVEKLARRRKRVLVVDDSITVREVERQLLRHWGYDVAVAVDGQEGWNTARAEQFDLVVSDVDMPRMNGFELVRALRADPALRQLPVIIVSYKDREEDRRRGLEVGANYYLTKSSFHDETFLQAVTDLIGEA